MTEILRRFTDKFGVTCNLPSLYEEDIGELSRAILSLEINGGRFVSFRVVEPLDSFQECIQGKRTWWLSFEYSFRDKTNTAYTGILFRIPKLVNNSKFYEQGYFIIEGQEKFPMIQSTIAKNMFNYDGESCTTRFSRMPITVIMVNRIFYVKGTNICIHTISKQLGYSVRDMFGEQFDRRIADLYVLLCQSYDTILLDPAELDSEARQNYFGNMSDKTLFLTIHYMCYLILGCSLGAISPTDISHIGNKLYRTYAVSTKNIIIRSIKPDKIAAASAGSIFKKVKDQIFQAINTEIIQRYKSGMVSIFGRQYKDMISTVSRRSHMDTIANVRKICIPTTEESKNKAMRQVHLSQYGFICPVETPESSSAGLTMVLAALSLISGSVDEENLLQRIADLDVCDSLTMFIIDNRIFTTYAKDLYRSLLHLKHTDRRYMFLSVFSENGIVHIKVSAGRIMRAVKLLDKDICLGSWDDMYGDIVLVDPTEQHYRRYFNLHDCFTVGLSVLSIPFANHNQGARSVFGTSMVKQAIQMYHEQAMECKEGIHLERPIVTTIVDDVIKEEGLYNGVNVRVLVSPYFGYNQEDAIVVTKQFVDRIGQVCQDVKITKVVLNPDDKIVKTPFTSSDKYDDGIVKEGCAIQTDEMYMSYIRSISGVWVLFDVLCKRDCVVRQIRTYTTDNSSQRVYEFVTTQSRKLSVGDKIASRHAQKGIITKIIDNPPIGKSTGFVPDIIINPQYMPSRMTLGQVHESNLAIYAQQHGIAHIDGTIFTKEFQKYLSSYSNTDTFVDPGTGLETQNPCEIGIVYYYILTHQSVDKIQHRFYGDNSVFTRQPVGGKSRKGGLRVGEMEVDALLAHNAIDTIYTAIRESDLCTANICIDCGYVLSFSNSCTLCGGSTNPIHISYAFKNICMSLLTYGITLSISSR